MTRLEIEQQAYRMLDKNATSPDAETQARMRGWLSNRLRRVMSMPGMDRLRLETLTLASVASQDRYGLPASVAKVNRIVDRSNFWSLVERDMNWLRRVEPNPSITSGTPEAYVLYGYQAVQIQPSNASSLFVKSTNAADTTQTVRIEGITSDGATRFTSVTLNGTTAVNVSSSISSWIAVSKFYLSVAAAGDVLLTEDSGAGTVLATINQAYTFTQYQSLILWPTPSSVRTYHLDIERKIDVLAFDYDVPPWPEDFHDILVYGMCADECLKMDDSRRNDFEAQYAARLRDLKMWIWDDASNRQISGRDARVGFSNLGGYFPADFWV